MIDDLDTANALREALDEETTGHDLSPDSWPSIARRLTRRPSARTLAVRLAPAATAVIIAMAVVAVLVINRQGISSDLTGPPVTHPNPPAAGSHGVLAFPGKVERLAAGYGSIWVGGLGVTYRVDPATDRITATIATPGAGRFSYVTTGFGAVWVSGANPSGTQVGVYRINPRHDQVAVFIPLPGDGRPGSLAVAGRFVWVSSTGQHGSVLRIDPRTNEIHGQPIDINPGLPGALVPGLGVLWVNANNPTGPLTAINPATGTVILHTSLAWTKITNVSAVGAGSLWVTGVAGVQRVNPATGRITATIPLARPSQIVFVRGLAYVITVPMPGIRPVQFRNITPGTLGCIDPATNKITCKPVPIGNLPAFYTAAPDGLWITNLANQTLTHYAPNN